MHYFLRNYGMNAKIHNFSVRLYELGSTTEAQLPTFYIHGFILEEALPKRLQFDATDARIGSTNECKGAGIPSQYHPGPGGICANSIGHGKKRNNMRSTARVSP